MSSETEIETRVAIPTPKFAIGDTIYTASWVDSSEYRECPDCLGASQWPVTSPAGEDHFVRCPTCGDSVWGNLKGKIKFYKAAPFVRQLTIGSVRIDTASEPGRRVSYMCKETGIGSGSVYFETNCYSDEPSAMIEANRLADAETRRIQERDKKRNELRVLPMASQAVKGAREAMADAKYALEELKRKIIELPENSWEFNKAQSDALREVSFHLVSSDDEMREGED